ncbi:MAG: hypothetical protein ACEPOV_14285 [Hyphomicrobiales bacterium]
MALLKILFGVIFLMIIYQDFRERKVSVVFYIMLMLVCIVNAVLNMNLYLWILNFILNISLIGLFILTFFLITKIKGKASLFEMIGMGDIVFFIGLSFGIPFVSYISLLTLFSLLTLITHLVVMRYLSDKSIPLAGWFSIWFIGVLFLEKGDLGFGLEYFLINGIVRY